MTQDVGRVLTDRALGSSTPEPVPVSALSGDDRSRVVNWGAGSPPPPDQWWSEILTSAQLRLLLAINEHDARFLADRRREITCDRLRRYGLVRLIDEKLRLTDWGRDALTEFAEADEYEIDRDGFVIYTPFRDSDGNPEGGDGTAPSRSDDSAARRDRPNDAGLVRDCREDGVTDG